MPYDETNTVVGLVITPDPASAPADSYVQFVLTAEYEDGHFENITGQAIGIAAGAAHTHPVEMWATPGTSATFVTIIHGRAVCMPPTGTETINARWGPSDAGAPDPVLATPVTLTVTASTATSGDMEPDSAGRFLIAFDDPTYAAYVTFTRLDDHPNLVTSYSIDRGRQYELDRTDTGTATVQITDPDGLLDPTNPDGPYYGKIRPLLQAAIGRHNPITDEWQYRYRGYIDTYDYEIDPSQQLNRLTVSLVDQFEILNNAEMVPGQFGDTPPPDSEGQIYYPGPYPVHDKIQRILNELGLPDRWRSIMDGSVSLQATVYSPGESVLSALWECADAEMPAVATLFCDRRGRFCFRPRRAKFEPDVVATEFPIADWDYHEWTVGDGTAVAAAPATTVQVRQLGFQRGLSKIINNAHATPLNIPDEDVAGQTVTDLTSVGQYGMRSWSADGLLTQVSLVDSATALVETKRFAQFYVDNFSEARDRISQITFRSLRPGDPRAAALWLFVNTVDIGDSITVTVAAPGGGGFTDEQYFVEGIHEEVRPLNPDWDDVTLRLDLSSRDYYLNDPWADDA
jgi:hypothetical protein